MKPFNSRNVFNLTNERKFTCNMGKLIPFMMEEVYPGDDWKVKTECVLRLQPMLAPIMHRVDVFTHFWFVPSRLLWKDWESYITGGRYGNDSPNKDGSNPYVKPYVTLTSPSKTALSTYLGLPCVQNYADNTTYDPGTYTVDAMPFRAIQLIWNENYRDENLQDEVDISLEGGEDVTVNTTDLPVRCWEKDYFTSALPWQQRGDPVYLPLGVSAPVIGDGKSIGFVTDGKKLGLQTSKTTGTNNYNVFSNGNCSHVNLTTANTFSTPSSASSFNAIGLSTIAAESGMYANLSSASAVTVSDVRTAFQVQKFLEKSARAGYRYIEYILEHFGVHSPDARLQRPEFLGGGRSPVIVSEVLQTSETTANGTAQGNMAGHGINVNANHAFTKSFTEQGFIIGLMSILPRTSYQQGINRMWLRQTKYDYLVPVLSHLSMQGIMTAELYQSGNATDTTIWGYQNRYDELRRRESHVAGDFVDNMNYWHMGRIFANKPELNDDFVASDPTKRIFAVTEQSSDCCIVDLLVNARAIRPLPKHGNPGLIDHG